MSRVLYFDCFSGISGDMALGAMLDAGLPLEELKRALGTLSLGNAHVHAERVLRAGVSATRFTVHEHPHGHEQHSHGAAVGSGPSQGHGHAHDHAHDHHPHRSLPEIFSLIDRSGLTPDGRARAKAMFERLAEA